MTLKGFKVQKNHMEKQFPLLLISILFFACSPAEDDTTPPLGTSENLLKIKLQFDPDQIRLGNFGEEVSVPAGNAASTPDFHAMSIHFMELVPTALTPYKAGEQIYQGEEVVANNPNSFNFTTAIDFDKAIVVDEGEVFLEIPLKNITPGTYKHIRTSVAYQNYEVQFNLLNVPYVGDLPNQSGTIASFVGYNTSISDLEVNQMSFAVNDFKLQGFWAFETGLSDPWSAFNQVFSGEAPEGSTTVVNPFPNAPIPQGSCVVSGSLDQDLVITGAETEDIVLTLSYSINDSFEWIDLNGNGEWDIDASDAQNSEGVVDMGLRGLKGIVE